MFSIPRSLGIPVRHSLRGDSRMRILLALTDPDNPTGRLLDPVAADELNALARSGATIFISETYRDFAFRPAPNSSFGQQENIVVCNTMTKFYGLGRLRVGWILAEKRKALQLSRAKRLISGHDSEYSLWLARQVLKSRERFVKRARRVYSENARLTAEFIDDTDGISGTIGVTPFCLVKYARGPGSVTLARRVFERTGVLVSPGDFFGAPKAFRLCFTLERGALEEGLRRLSLFLNRQTVRMPTSARR
jgi:aspartate/methionine/tyrosine aminotransferase